MGYKCTPKTECHDSGYIVTDIDPNILKNGNIDDMYNDDNGLTLSQYNCKKSNDDDYYEDYDYYVTDYSVRSEDISTADNQMVCCRDPALFKKEDNAQECKDKDKLCPRLNKDRDCQDTDIQQKCKKLCGLCPEPVICE